MSFQEYTYTGETDTGRYNTGIYEVMVDIDTETKKPIDVYTYIDCVNAMPKKMGLLFTVEGKNPLFVHASDNQEAYNLIKRNAIKCDAEKD